MVAKLRLDIPLVLPHITDAQDAVVQRLISELQGRAGIIKVHVHMGDGDTPAQLCVHHNPEWLSLARTREIVHAAGAQIAARFGHGLWQTEGIQHARRARTITDMLQGLPGVLDAQASATGLVHVDFDRHLVDEQTILSALAQMGVRLREAAAASVHEGHDETGRQHEAASYGHDHTPGNSHPHDHQGVHRHDHKHDHKHPHKHQHDHGHGDGHGHDHAHGHGHGHAHGGILGANTELIFALVCGVLLGATVAIEHLWASAPGWLIMGGFLLAYGFGGCYTLREALDNLRLRRFEIDSLMLVAAAGAAALGSWAEGALLLFLFSLGHALEHYAMGRAQGAISALAKLAPDTATVRRDGQAREIPIAELAVGDIVLVKPNERLPADGFVVRGSSAVNQAAVTGESMPVDKHTVQDAAQARIRPDSVDAASRVFAGTINGAGALEIEATRRAGESALARIIKMVSEAETRKSPTQRFTDRFERIFVPAVLGLVCLLLFAWVVIDEPFRESFYRAMAVLVAASPCALAIATPSAVLSGIARAARGGVLIKGGAPLEELGSLQAMAFDKTGTLTEGRPRITDVIAVGKASEEELLATAVAVESLSDHPLASAIARDGRARLQGRHMPAAEDIQSLTGRGVVARLDGDAVWIGKAEMFGTEGIPPLGPAAQTAMEQLRALGRTTMAVRRGNQDLGAIGLLDTPRPGARAALQKLRELGIHRMIMISGDHGKAAQAIAAEVGLDEAWGDLMPEDKVEAIRKLRQETKVAMVGDGVNDAPAMAHATVGIAMGAAGSDVALETADIALMADDLRHLPFAVGLSRRTRSVIRQNVFVSLGMVAILVPATLLGLGIGPAVAMHEGSTLLVVLNALRLLAYREQ